MGEVSEGTGRFAEEQTLVLVLYQPAGSHRMVTLLIEALPLGDSCSPVREDH